MRKIITIALVAVLTFLSMIAKLIVRENLAGIDEGNMWPPEKPEQIHPHAAEPFPYWMLTEDL